MRTLLGLALSFAVVVLSSPAAAGDGLLVRSSVATTPCLDAVARAWERTGGRALVVETGGLRDEGAWDVLVGSGVELTRALEGGEADVTSDVEVATIPWVLHVASGGDVGALSDVARSGAEIVLPAGDASYEARRALSEEGAGRVLETRDVQKLRSAPVALVPLSLAGPGRHLSVDVPPIRVGAAVGRRSKHAADARAFVEFLGSDEGQRAFSSCALE